MSRSKTADNTPKALVENLEKRQLMAADNIIGIKIAKRVDTDGLTALNSNRITIAFDKVVRVTDANAFRSFGYANDLLSPSAQRKVTVGLAVERDSTGKILTITTDRLVRKGSILQILPGALTDKAGNPMVYDASSANKKIVFTVGQNKPRYTMSNRNWKPTELAYFSNDVFSSAPTPITANVTPSAATVRPQLVAFLNAKVAATGTNKLTAAQRDEALAIFDDAGTTSLIPAANLRAAMVSLYGTVGQPAVLSYLRGNSNVSKKPFGTIDFAAGLSNDVTVGQTTISANGRLNTLIRNEFAGEDFRALSGVLAHEIMHQDTVAANPSTGELPSSQDEEIIANAVQTIVYAQQALIDSTFLGNGTQLVTKLNDQLLALLNSGDALFPYGGIKQAPNINTPNNVFPGAKSNPGGWGSTTVKSFEDWTRREYIARGFSAGGTNTNPTAQAILKNIVGSNVNVTKFGADTQKFLDTQNLVLVDVNYIRLAQALKLTF